MLLRLLAGALIACAGAADVAIEEYLHKKFFLCRPADRAYTWVVGSPGLYTFHEGFECGAGGRRCERPAEACACRYAGVLDAGATQGGSDGAVVTAAAAGYGRTRRWRRGAPLSLCESEKCMAVPAACLELFKRNGGVVDTSGSKSTKSPGVVEASSIGPLPYSGGEKRSGLETEKPWESVRLSRSVVPMHQKLRVQPDVENGNFKGMTDILIEITEPTDIVYLHVNNLEIASCKVTTRDGKELKMNEFFEHKDNEYLVVKMDGPLHKGQIVLAIEYTGSLTENKLYGFFRSAYSVPETGESRYVLATKLTTTNARKMFPCFDEPDKKVRFEISVLHSDKLPVALSNMPLRQAEPQNLGDGNLLSEFETTPKMSSYLVALVVCDYKHRQRMTKGGIPIRIWAPEHELAFTEHSLDVAAVAMDFYDEYFGYPYKDAGVPKIDIAGVPEYPTGAVESWGCVTFKLPWLLYRPNVTAAAWQQNTADLVCHELSHMWFGNLVTMSWWDDLWLNEGFATFMALRCLMRFDNDRFAADAAFLRRKQLRTMEKDQLSSTHAVRAPVVTHKDIKQDFITYGKGTGVLRMLHGALGEETFQRGVQRYIKSHAFGNTVTGDLWAAMQDELDFASALAVAPMMDGWLDTAGFPLLQWDSAARRLVQLGRYDAESGLDAAARWHVPVTYKILVRGMADEQRQPVVMAPGDEYASLPLVTADNAALVKLNVDYTGWYRTNYDAAAWKSLVSLMRASALHGDEPLSPADRVQLIDDAFELAKGYGRVALFNYTVPLSMLADYFEHETHYEPFAVLLAKVKWLAAAINRIDRDAGLRLETLVSTALKKTYAKYAKDTWLADDSVSYMVRSFRADVVKAACAFGTDECVNAAAVHYEKYKAGGYELPAGKESLILGAVLLHRPGTAAFGELMQRLEKSSDGKERSMLIKVLAENLSDEGQVRDFLGALSESESSSDSDYLAGATALFSANRHGGPVAAAGLDHFDYYLRELGKADSVDAALLRKVTAALAKATYDRRLADKLAALPPSLVDEQTAAVAARNVDWALTAGHTAVVWLYDNVPW